MITSAKNSLWTSDHDIESLDPTGLSAASIVRQKLFTIDERLVIKQIGKLSKKDQKEVIKKFQKHLVLT